MNPAAPTPVPPTRITIEQVQALSDHDVIARYAKGVENFDRRAFQLTDEQLDMAFLESAGVGKWPVRVLVGHVADAELSFVFRLRRAVAEDHPVFEVWDENAFIERGLYGPLDGSPEAAKGTARPPIAAFVATIHTLRLWIAPWLRSLSPADLQRTALHPVRGPQTVRSVLNYATWHLEHHAWFLRAKLDRLAPKP